MLIGCGAMGHVHCRGIGRIDGLELVAAVDTDAERARRFQAEFGFKRIGTDYRAELERGGFDVVISATHWGTRKQILEDCFRARKHVLAEKPLSVLPDEVDALLQSAVAAGLKLRVGFLERFRPMFHKIVALLREGTIRQPLVYGFAHYQRPAGSSLAAGWEYYKKLLAGGLTPNIDCGIHKCDLVRWFSGAEPVSVYSVGQRLESDSPGSNYAHSVFKMSDGSVLNLEDVFSRTAESRILMWMIGQGGEIRYEYAGTHLYPTYGSEEDSIRVWQVDPPHTSTYHTPAALKAVGPQMETFLREIEADADLGGHHQDVRTATEMVMGSLLSEHRGEIVRFPLTARDRAEIASIVQRP